MLVRHRLACLSAAVLAVVTGASPAEARDLVWDADGAAGTVGTEGTGTWDLTNFNWVENFVPGTPATGTNVQWLNSPADSATIGQATNVGTTNAAPFAVVLGSNITVQNLTIGQAADGTYYDILDQEDGGQTLTLNGNLTKSGASGAGAIRLTNAIQLGAGNHVFAAKDSPGDAAPELTIGSAIAGSGSVTIDNASGGYEQWGTIAFTRAGTYTGGTNVNSGRLVIRQGNALGSGVVAINNAGMLAIGGPSVAAGDTTIANAIQLNRSDYGSGDAFNKYTESLIFNNDGGTNTHTLTGAIDVASADARIAVNTNRVILSGPLTTSTGTGILSIGGDFAGFLQLTQDNTAFAAAGGAFRIRGGVEVEASSEANLGGPTSKLYLSGGTIRPSGSLGASGSAFMTNFGAHDISGAPINTGLNLDAGQVFTVNNLNGTAIGTRGTGTINFNGTNTFTGAPFFDGGVANVNGTTSVGGVRLRNATLNINNGATFSTTNSYSSIALDNGENATVNLNGNAIFNAFNADFNVSDNAGSTGTLNIRDTSSFTAAGLVFVGKSSNAVGTINQSGGSLTLTRNGDFTFVLGDGRGGRTPVGNYNFSGGTFTSAGEVFVGEGNTGTGNWTQTGGTATVNNWFVVGREGGLGNVDLSGGTITKAGGGDTEVDAQGGLGTSTMTVRNAAEYRAQTGTFKVGQLGGGSGILNLRDSGKVTVSAGEFWIGNGGATGVVNIQDGASLTVSNWLAIGRGGASVGNLNVSGGTVTKTAGSNGFLAVGSGGTGTLTQTGGTLNIFGTRIGEASNGTMNLSGGVANFTGEFSIGREGNNQGTLNISGTANVTVPDAVFGAVGTGTAGGTVNLDGGTLTGASFTAGATSTGAKTFNFNGGSLRAAADSANFIDTKIASVVRAGGAKIDTNGSSVTVNSALTHDAALGGTADGGLTKSGAGTLTLTGTNTYTGATTVSGGTLAVAAGGSIANTGTLAVATALVNNGTVTTAGGGTVQSVTGTGTLNVTGGTLALTSATVGQLNTQGALGLSGTGKLDLRKAQFQVAGDQYATFVGHYAAGRLLSSDAAASPTNRLVGIRYDGANTTARYTTYGDVNLDGRFNGTDVALINGANAFGLPAGSATYATGDTNYDGRFNGTDVARINASNSFGTGPVTLVAGDAAAGDLAVRASGALNAIAPTSGTSTIDLQYDPATGDLRVVTNGIGYGTVTLGASSSVFKDGVFGTSPLFYSDDNGDGTSLFFGVLVGQQTQTVLLPGVLDPNQSLASLLNAISVQGITNGPAASQITFSSVGDVVPEPTTLAAIAAMGGLFGRRRRRSA